MPRQGTLFGEDQPEEEPWAYPLFPALPTAPARATAGEAGPSFDAHLERFENLADLEAEAKGCRRCGLREGCRGVVFGEGNPHAAVMLVGEGPGKTEDELGRPFVGRAGELLDRILDAAGFRREEVYINNVVMCRPPGNRVPTDAEMAACLPWLRARMRLMRPPIVVCMGSTAARALISSGVKITQARGRWHRLGEALLMPTYHPAALLRDESKKRPVWEDFKQVRDAYKRLQELGPGGLSRLAEELAGEPGAAGVSQ